MAKGGTLIWSRELLVVWLCSVVVVVGGTLMDDNSVVRFEVTFGTFPPPYPNSTLVAQFRNQPNIDVWSTGFNGNHELQLRGLAKTSTTLRQVLNSIFGHDQYTVHQQPLSTPKSPNHFDASALGVISPNSSSDHSSRYSRYHTFDEVTNILLGYATKYPDNTYMVPIGYSIEKRPINALKVTTTPNPKNNSLHKAEILFLGAHHAREWISMEVVLCLLDYVITEGIDKNNPNVTTPLQDLELWFIPVVNPDGFVYTHEQGVDELTQTSKRLWRKNRRQYNNITYGVDLNRNYNDDWGGPGSSDVLISSTYHGKHAFSEPETKAIRDFTGYWNASTWIHSLNNLTNNIIGCLSYHAYSELILYPPASTTTPAKNGEFLHGLSMQMSLSMNDVSADGYFKQPYPRASYTAEQASSLYITSGAFCGWWYNHNGGKACVTIELRPNDDSSYGFLLPSDQIAPTCDENIGAVNYFITYLHKHRHVKDWMKHVFQRPSRARAPSGPPSAPTAASEEDNGWDGGPDTSLIVILCTVAGCVMAAVVLMLFYSWRITRRRLTAQAMTGDVEGFNGNEPPNG